MEEKKLVVEHVDNVDGIEKIDAFRATGIDLTPEMHEIVGNAIAKSFGRQENDTGQFEPDVEYIIEKMMTLSEEQASEILRDTIEEHDNDPNFPGHTLELIKQLVQGPKAVDMDLETYTWTVRTNAALIHFHSPYAEVRAVADPYDDPTAPSLTIRAYFLGLAWMCISTVINTFFTPRQPGISLGTSLIQLLIYPCGRLFERVLPDWGITFRGRRHSLNPGRWSYKEQMLATIIVNIANGPGYIMNTYLVLKMPAFFNQQWVSFGFEMLLALSTQMLGLGYAGILRRVVIYPIKAIWPGVLPTLALNRALILDQRKETINGWTMSRYKFFFCAFLIMFFYFWIPNYLFTALHAFNWMTWIAPNNFNLAQITGFYGGMGFNPWSTFDWNVAFTGRLVTPAFSTIQQYIGSVLSGLIILGMFYSNFYWSAYIPLNSNDAFTNTGQVYNVTQVLTNNLLDEQKYQQYSFPFYGAANIWGQGAWFAWYPLCLIYVGVSQWPMLKQAYRTLVASLKRNGDQEGSMYNDPHSRMMRAYKEVPDWWYLGVLILALVFGIIGFEVYPLNVPVWTLFATIGICIVFLIPMAVLNSMANVSFAMNVFFQLLAGWWFPGNPIAMLMMMNYGYNMDAQAEAYITNQKMAHYAKVSPRGIFFGQMSAVIINCFVFVGMTNWMIGNFKGMCEWSQPNHFVCEAAHAVYSQAALYGVVGDRRTFDYYPILPYCFLMGAAAGLVIALLQKYGHKIKAMFLTADHEDSPLNSLFNLLATLKYFNPAALWNGATNTWTGGYNLSYKTGGVYISILFMIFIKRRYTAWWQKYNYLIEAGFDIGVAVSAILQTFALNWNGYTLSWWGNNVATAGIDYAIYNKNVALLPIPKKGYFGPAPGHFP
jgi:OPT family small oligopeptide transporter